MYIDQPEQAAYVQQPTWHSTPTENQSWVATPVPSSPSGWESDSPSLWEDLPQQVANGRRDHQGQQSTYSRQSEQVAYGQQPIRDSTSPRIQSRAATPIPSNPPGMNLDSMTPSRSRIWNQAFNLPFDRNRDDLIKQAKTGKPTHVIKKSKRPQKEQKLEGLTAGYAVGAPPETGSRAASRHCPTCTCTQALVSPKNLSVPQSATHELDASHADILTSPSPLRTIPPPNQICQLFVTLRSEECARTARNSPTSGEASARPPTKDAFDVKSPVRIHPPTDDLIRS